VIEDGRDLRPGQFVKVEITASGDHDLWARVLD